MQYEDDIVFLSYSNRRFRLCTYDMKTGEVSLFSKTPPTKAAPVCLETWSRMMGNSMY